jgi:hypothetical protein
LSVVASKKIYIFWKKRKSRFTMTSVDVSIVCCMAC